MKKIIIHKSYKSIRKPPKNLKNEDKDLFAHEFTKTIPSSHVILGNKILIINQNLFSKNLYLFTKYIYFYFPGILRVIKDVIKSFKNSKKNITKIDKGMWITDNKSSVYFHSLCDALGKYQMTKDEFKNYPVLIPEIYDIDWIKEFLETLEIEFKILKNSKRYVIDELLIPSYPAPSGNFNNENITKLAKNIIDKCDINTKDIEQNKRIWISREAARRKVNNKSDLEQILKKYNFEDCILEELTLTEKVQLFQSAEIIAGSHGSGLTNMIFMNKKTKVVDVRDPKDNIKNAFFTLASEFDLDYYYMEREADDKIIIDSDKLDKIFSEALNGQYI